MIWRTFHDTDRRRGSHNDEEAIKREVHENRPRQGFDVDDDVKPGDDETPRHGRHEFR